RAGVSFQQAVRRIATVPARDAVCASGNSPIHRRRLGLGRGGRAWAGAPGGRVGPLAPLQTLGSSYDARGPRPSFRFERLYLGISQRLIASVARPAKLRRIKNS